MLPEQLPLCLHKFINVSLHDYLERVVVCFKHDFRLASSKPVLTPELPLVEKHLHTAEINAQAGSDFCTIYHSFQYILMSKVHTDISLGFLRCS